MERYFLLQYVVNGWVCRELRGCAVYDFAFIPTLLPSNQTITPKICINVLPYSTSILVLSNPPRIPRIAEKNKVNISA